MEQVHVSKMSSLSGRYVRVRPDNPWGRELFGLYVGAVPDDYGAGRVFDFSTKRFYLVAEANCRPVESYNITGGFRDLAVSVETGFGVGVVIDEYSVRGELRLRVRNGSGQVTNASLGEIRVQVPKW